MKPPHEIIGRIIERRRRFEADGVGGDVHFKPSHATGEHGAKLTTVNVRLDDGREGYAKYAHPDRVRLFIRPIKRREIAERKSRGKISSSWFD